MKNVFALQDGVTTPEKAENCRFGHETPHSRIGRSTAPAAPFLCLGYPPAAASRSTPENNAIENIDIRASGQNGY